MDDVFKLARYCMDNNCFSIGINSFTTGVSNNWKLFEETGLSSTGTYTSPNWWEFDYKHSNFPEQQTIPINVQTIIYEAPELKKEKYPMKTIYHVMVVTLDEEIILDTKVVAEDFDDAKFTAKVFGKLEEKKLKPKEVTIVVNELAQVKVRKEVKEVKVVKE